MPPEEIEEEEEGGSSTSASSSGGPDASQVAAMRDSIARLHAELTQVKQR